MSSCNHDKLVLLPDEKDRLQCRHCHLTIKADELGDEYCPECFEIHDEKRYDFEKVEAAETATTRYRCEECGETIECE
jgi:hypothetical protein